MFRQPSAVSFAMVVACLPFQFTNCEAGTETKAHFDLPAEPLDRALRDFAIQAKCNLSYEPSLVTGLKGAALRGDYALQDALVILLKGTSLHSVAIAANSVEVVSEADSKPQGRFAETVHIDGAATETDEVSRTENDTRKTTKLPQHDEKALEEIMVTGSHIRGVPSAAPVIEIDREQIERSGFTSVGDVMLSMPQDFGGGYNAATAVGNSVINGRYSDNPAGASVPNLRGLGPGSTLTLIDGHRMAAGLSGGGADIASIPIDAIERIEVLTDSASAAYGSDAVAGVVNVILKKDYQGALTSLSYGRATQGGGTEERASQMVGTNWSGGNVMLALEHMHQSEIDASQRGFSSSSPEPNSLLPEIRYNAVTLSARQSLSSNATAFIDGLYVARDADTYISYEYLPASVESPATLRKYAVAVGVNLDLSKDWKATLTETEARDATVSNAVYLTEPTITPTTTEHALGGMRNVEANANGAIAHLPTGSVQLALGLGYRRESFADSFGVTGSPLTAGSEGDRNIRYAFGEISAPLVEHSERFGIHYLDLVVSGRTEHYSDFGSKSVPKLGLSYGPTSSINIRSTWGKAFRAPNLYDVHSVPQLVIQDLPDSLSATGNSLTMLRYGGNPNLEPETAKAWSLGVDFSPVQLEGARLSVTGFDIKYTNRISQIGNAYLALTDPYSAFFVTRSPTSAAAQSVYNSYPADQVFNLGPTPFDPATVGAIVDSRTLNVSNQRVRGADITANYKLGNGANTVLLFLNGAFLDLIQQNAPGAPEQTLSGYAFYPAKWRARSGATWKLNKWALTGSLNYLAGETNNQVTPYQSVGSWTTLDASVRFVPTLSGPFSGLSFNLAAINLCNRNPPYVALPAILPLGLNYDSSNTSPVGRFIRFQVSKQW